MDIGFIKDYLIAREIVLIKQEFSQNSHNRLLEILNEDKPTIGWYSEEELIEQFKEAIVDTTLNNEIKSIIQMYPVYSEEYIDKALKGFSNE